jgi:hypothetical protein
MHVVNFDFDTLTNHLHPAILTTVKLTFPAEHQQFCLRIIELDPTDSFASKSAKDFLLLL